MAKAKTLTVGEVAELGTERLAALLLQAAEYDPALMHSVRFAVASRIDAAAAAAEIDQQIRSFRRSTAFVDYRQRMAFARDLGVLVDAIVGPLADLDPAGALTRMLDFIASPRRSSSEAMTTAPSAINSRRPARRWRR